MSKDIPAPERLKILVIGDSCTDIYQFGSCSRLSPEAPVPILKMTTSKQYCGMASNVYQNLKSFGHEVFLFTQKEIITKTRIVEEKFNHHILRIDDEPSISPLNWSDYLGPDLSSFDGFVISDYNKGFLLKEKTKDLISLLRSFNKTIFVDTKKEDLSLFSGCIVKINNEEYLNSNKNSENTELIVTLGSGGAKWKGKTFPAIKTEVFDVCGAGDTFLAGFVDSYIKNKDIGKSIEFANKCASIAVTNFGTYCLNSEDIREINK